MKFRELALIVFVILLLWCQVSYWLSMAGTKEWDGPSGVEFANCAFTSAISAGFHTQALLQTTSQAWTQMAMKVNQWGARGFSACALYFVLFFSFCQSCLERPCLAPGQSGVNNPFLPSKIIAEQLLMMTLSYRILRMLTLFCFFTD